MKKEELLALYQQNKAARQGQTQQPTQQQEQPQDIAGLIGKINPVLGNTVRGFAGGMSKAMGTDAGTTASNPYLDAYAKKYVENQFENDPNSLDYKARMAQIEKDNAIAKSWNDFGGSDMPSAEETAQQLGVDPEDMMTKPEMRTFRGRPYQVNTPTLKPMLPPKEGGQIQSLRSMDQDMRRNIGMLTPEVQKRMNPLDPRSARGGIGSFILKVESGWSPSAREYIDFKSQTDQLFQDFRKDVTGAQAALKELGWLAPDYPEPNDPPETYYQKASTAIKKIAEGEQLLLNFYSQQGYRVGDMKKGALKGDVPPMPKLGEGSDGSMVNEDSTLTPEQQAKRARLQQKYGV